MNTKEFNQKLNLVSPKFFDLYEGHNLTSISLEMTLGALATYFIYLVESSENTQIDDLMIFIEECIEDSDKILNQAILHHFLLAIYELESLEIIEKNTLLNVLDLKSKALLQSYLNEDQSTSMSNGSSLSRCTKVL
ncbi:MAG: hypothetical protein KC646_16825 [Candidatus Cloacimonetes bacterium]|nr:hypothetical protein [Candidatus Cloacimonadota bacterium]